MTPVVELLRAALDRGAQAGAAGADHDHVVLDGLDLGDVEHGHSSQVLRSVITPIETQAHVEVGDHDPDQARPTRTACGAR